MINQGSYKILYIKIGGNFVPIGCLTDNSFSETAGTIQTTTRENVNGWGSVTPTNQGYSIPFSGVSTLSDLGGTIASYDSLQGLKRSRSKIEWQIKSDQGGNTETGFGYITDLSNSATVGAEVTFSGTILGSGLPVTIPGVQAAAPANFRNEDPAPTYCLVLWDKSVTGVMISYRVYKAGVFFREFMGDVAQGTLTGLAASTLYEEMTVRAWDGTEESPDSNVISFTTASGGNIVVIDNLDSTSPTDALSANQGRVLDEKKLDDVIQGSNVTIDKTDPLNPIISATATPTVIVDDLTSTAADQALSANMGRQLNVTKLNDVFAGANVAVDKTDPLAPIISSLPQTSAGSIRRVWFTGDELNLSTLFYETSTDKGLIATRQQQVTNGDNQTTFFDVDFIGHAAEADENLVGGDYTGHLEVEIDSNAGNQRYDIELYVADAQGVPFDSGVPGELIGDLGFQTLARATTGIFDIEDDNPTSVVYAFTLAATLVVPVGTRVRYHISATKVGTDGGNVVMSLYSGSNYLSYLDAPIEVDTAGVVNYNENITGATQDDVNVNVEAMKAGLNDANTFTAEQNFRAEITNLGYDETGWENQVNSELRLWNSDNSYSRIRSFLDESNGNALDVFTYAFRIWLEYDSNPFEIRHGNVTSVSVKSNEFLLPATEIADITEPKQVTTKEWADGKLTNKIGIEGGEQYRMTGQIHGGEETLGTLPSGQKTTLIRQIGGFLSYQGIETGVGSDIYNYSEGLGEEVLTNNEGAYSVAIGYRSLENNKGLWTTAIGNQAGQNNQGIIGTFVGFNSGLGNTGNNASFIGSQSGLNNTGENAVGVGEQAMRDNTGSYNAAVGNSALPKATGQYNTAIGSASGQMPTSTDPMPYNNTTSVGANSKPDKDNQVVLGDINISSVKTGNSGYRAVDNEDLVPKVQVAISDISGEMTGATKADNQIVISDANYGDGSTAVAGTLYFIKP